MNDEQVAAATVGTPVKTAVAISAVVALAATAMILYMLRMTRLPAVSTTSLYTRFSAVC